MTRILSVFLILLSLLPAAAQKTAPVVPTPKSVLGFEPGATRTIADWKQISSYFAKLDAASDRVRVETLGTTAEGRDLIAAFISAPDNLRRLDQLQAIQRKLADPRLIASPREREELLQSGKVFVTIACSIHSTEIVASQAALRLAYALATETTPETNEILHNTVLLLVPSPNPDGIDIVTDWYRKTLGGPSEGTEPPRLYHRYAGHDNNRDWYMLTQPETQCLTRFWYRRWFPQIVLDLHQQWEYGPRATLPPFADPPNPNIPALLLRQTAVMGEKMATDLTAAGFSGILTRGQFDTWWPGGLRGMAYYHNAVGLLSEIASAKLMSPLTVSREALNGVRGLDDPLKRSTTFPEPWTGGTWTPETIAAMELVECRSVLRYAARFRCEVLENQLSLGEAAIRRGSNEAPYAFVLSSSGMLNDPEARARLVNILWSQGVEVERVTNQFTIEGVPYPEDSFLIRMNQPLRALVKTLLERQEYPQSGEAPYDVTGWTLSGVMGIPVAALGRPVPNVKTEPVTGLLPEAARWVDQPRPLPSAENATARLGIYQSFSPTEDEGWTRWLLDMERVPYRSVHDRDIRAGGLRAGFDVLVLPDQPPTEMLNGLSAKDYPEEFTGGITPEGARHLREFVAAGGRLVCLGRAADFAIDHLQLPVRNVVRGKPRTEFACPGSILLLTDGRDKVGTFVARWNLLYGVFFQNGAAFEPTSPNAPVSVVSRYSDLFPLVSGLLVGPDLIAGKPALVGVEVGKGLVLLYGYRPQFRGQTHGTFQRFLGYLTAPPQATK